MVRGGPGGGSQHPHPRSSRTGASLWPSLPLSPGPAGLSPSASAAPSRQRRVPRALIPWPALLTGPGPGLRLTRLSLPLPLLLVSGNLDKQTGKGSTALHYCCLTDNAECLKLLLRGKASIETGEAPGPGSLRRPRAAAGKGPGAGLLSAKGAQVLPSGGGGPLLPCLSAVSRHPGRRPCVTGRHRMVVRGRAQALQMPLVLR